MKYEEFIKQKAIIDIPTGIEIKEVNEKLFDWQSDIVKWSLRRGRSCIFADCGLGKTPMQLSWADALRKRDKNILIVAPLAVSSQTIKEGLEKFNIASNVN